jgi:nucleoside-diphosphate-sugar epimerase
MGERILVVGGTGPTGVPIVNGLLERGHDVTILHRGHHEDPSIESRVTHIHADPYDPAAVQEVFATRRFDATLAMYGRLRAIAEAAVGSTGRFLSVGGVPAHRGWMNPWLYDPAGVPVPIGEGGPTVDRAEDDEKGFRIRRTEERVFDLHPTACHVRYPYVYGPKQLAPREWCIVRRILDGRREIIVPDDGLTLHHHGFTENLAHALLLAVDQPEPSAGKLYNVGDDEVLTLRQVIELVAAALDAELDIVSLPWEFAVPARPMITQPLTTHRVMDISRIRADLGYSDLVPAREAIGLTAQWLVANRPDSGGLEEKVLTDPFDYPAEDALIAAWRGALASLRSSGAVDQFATPPGFGLAYSGPGGRSRSNKEFEA